MILSGPIGDNEINMEQGFSLAEKDIAREKILGGRAPSPPTSPRTTSRPSIGSACTRKLLNDGYKVMILDEASPEALADQAITERAGAIDILPSQRGVPAGDGKLAFSANSISPIAAAWFVVLAERQWVPLSDVTVQLQNDPIKEYIARGTQFLPIEAALRLSMDTFEYLNEVAPNWLPISVSGSTRSGTGCRRAVTCHRRWGRQ